MRVGRPRQPATALPAMPLSIPGQLIKDFDGLGRVELEKCLLESAKTLVHNAGKVADENWQKGVKFQVTGNDVRRAFVSPPRRRRWRPLRLAVQTCGYAAALLAEWSFTQRDRDWGTPVMLALVVTATALYVATLIWDAQ